MAIVEIIFEHSYSRTRCGTTRSFLYPLLYSLPHFLHPRSASSHTELPPGTLGRGERPSYEVPLSAFDQSTLAGPGPLTTDPFFWSVAFTCTETRSCFAVRVGGGWGGVSWCEVLWKLGGHCLLPTTCFCCSLLLPCVWPWPWPCFFSRHFDPSHGRFHHSSSSWTFVLQCTSAMSFVVKSRGCGWSEWLAGMLGVLVVVKLR
jgi:hypothetical protein